MHRLELFPLLLAFLHQIDRSVLLLRVIVHSAELLPVFQVGRTHVRRFAHGIPRNVEVGEGKLHVELQFGVAVRVAVKSLQMDH